MDATKGGHMEGLFATVEWFYVRTGIGMPVLRVLNMFMEPLDTEVEGLPDVPDPAW
jgi:hypothetical protein